MWWCSVLFIEIFRQWTILSLRRIFLLLLRKEEEDTVPLFGCANSYYDTAGNPTGLHFFSFPNDVQQRIRWCNLLKRQHGKDGFFITKSTSLCSEHFKTEDMRKNVGRSLEIGERFIMFVRLFCCLDTKRKWSFDFRYCSVYAGIFFSLLKRWHLYFFVHCGLIRYLWTECKIIKL